MRLRASAVKRKHRRPNYAAFRSQSITESPPVFAVVRGTDQVRMWWFTFVSSRLNKGAGGGGRAAAWKRESESSGSRRQHSRSDVWTFLCVNQGHRGKWALWEDVLRQAYLKSCSLNQHDTLLSTVHQGYAKCLLPQCWISFFCPSSPFCSEGFFKCLCSFP